ncbi:hypothetical protein HXX76_014182 [Chlamydomonas incerta]|uniref:Chitin-binding type-3 domain-containing protein n=1 Tax=Chlamydomonas incerta TaxID=51695 RepID=A0A835VTK1_CHLIN|nr:hypothetical protein HXX76_014182 [Chlamydomonas incerta]|eukprot:KAG2425024.1 hypothetical protein HXX76_014182 [Chlamydomonas incerta]
MSTGATPTPLSASGLRYFITDAPNVPSLGAEPGDNVLLIQSGRMLIGDTADLASLLVFTANTIQADSILADNLTFRNRLQVGNIAIQEAPDGSGVDILGHGDLLLSVGTEPAPLVRALVPLELGNSLLVQAGATFFGNVLLQSPVQFLSPYVDVAGDLLVRGRASAQEVRAAANVSVDCDLHVGNSAYVGGNLYVGGNTTTRAFTISGDVNISSNMTLNNLAVQGTLQAAEGRFGSLSVSDGVTAASADIGSLKAAGVDCDSLQAALLYAGALDADDFSARVLHVAHLDADDVAVGNTAEVLGTLTAAALQCADLRAGQVSTSSLVANAASVGAARLGSVTANTANLVSLTVHGSMTVENQVHVSGNLAADRAVVSGVLVSDTLLCRQLTLQTGCVQAVECATGLSLNCPEVRVTGTVGAAQLRSHALEANVANIVAAVVREASIAVGNVGSLTSNVARIAQANVVSLVADTLAAQDLTVSVRAAVASANIADANVLHANIQSLDAGGVWVSGSVRVGHDVDAANLCSANVIVCDSLTANRVAAADLDFDTLSVGQEAQVAALTVSSTLRGDTALFDGTASANVLTVSDVLYISDTLKVLGNTDATRFTVMEDTTLLGNASVAGALSVASRISAADASLLRLAADSLQVASCGVTDLLTANLVQSDRLVSGQASAVSLTTRTLQVDQSIAFDNLAVGNTLQARTLTLGGGLVVGGDAGFAAQLAAVDVTARSVQASSLRVDGVAACDALQVAGDVAVGNALRCGSAVVDGQLRSNAVAATLLAVTDLLSSAGAIQAQSLRAASADVAGRVSCPFLDAGSVQVQGDVSVSRMATTSQLRSLTALVDAATVSGDLVASNARVANLAANTLTANVLVADALTVQRTLAASNVLANAAVVTGSLAAANLRANTLYVDSDILFASATANVQVGTLAARRVTMTGQVSAASLAATTLTVGSTLTADLLQARRLVVDDDLVCNALTVDGAAAFQTKAGLWCEGNCTIFGSVTVRSGLNERPTTDDMLRVDGTARISELFVTDMLNYKHMSIGLLDVSKTTTVAQQLTCQALTNEGQATLASASITGDVTAAGTWTVDGDLTVKGTAAFTKALSVGVCTVDSAISATAITAATSISAGSLVCRDELSIKAGRLDVGSSASVGADLDVSGSLSVRGAMDVVGALTVGAGGLTVTGASAMQSLTCTSLKTPSIRTTGTLAITGGQVVIGSTIIDDGGISTADVMVKVNGGQQSLNAKMADMVTQSEMQRMISSLHFKDVALDGSWNSLIDKPQLLPAAELDTVMRELHSLTQSLLQMSQSFPCASNPYVDFSSTKKFASILSATRTEGKVTEVVFEEIDESTSNVLQINKKYLTPAMATALPGTVSYGMGSNGMGGQVEDAGRAQKGGTTVDSVVGTVGVAGLLNLMKASFQSVTAKDGGSGGDGSASDAQPSDGQAPSSQQQQQQYVAASVLSEIVLRAVLEVTCEGDVLHEVEQDIPVAYTDPDELETLKRAYEASPFVDDDATRGPVLSLRLLSAQPAGSEPVFPWFRDDGWVPVYEAAFVGYRRYSTVVQGGALYVAMDEVSPGETPSAPNAQGSGWCPVWRSGAAYEQGEFVAVCRKAGYVEAEFYRASNAISASVPMPDITSTNLKDWIRSWQPRGMYLEGEYVFHGAEYFRAPMDGIVTEPGLPAVSCLEWVPLHNPAVAYLPGQFVVHSNVTYVAMSPPTVGTLPEFFNETGLSWVPLWEAKFPYAKSAYVWYMHSLYCAKQSSGPRLHNPAANPLFWQFVAVALQPVLDFDAAALGAVGSSIVAWPNTGSMGASHAALAKAQPAAIGGVGASKHVSIDRALQQYLSVGSSVPISWLRPTDAGSGGFTLAVVARLTSVGADERLVEFADPYSGCTVSLGRLGTSSTIRAFVTDAAGATCADLQAALPAGSETAFNLLVLTLGSSTVGTASALYINACGAPAASQVTAVRMPNLDVDCQIGKPLTGDALLLSADIRQVSVFALALPAYHLACLLRDLQVKWAMPQPWSAQALYPRGSVVSLATTLYGCVVDVPVGVDPAGPSGLWLPVYRDQVSFSAGDAVYHQGVGYVTVAATIQRVPPSPQNTSGTGMVPMWSSGAVYAKGCYVSHKGLLYFAMYDRDLQVEPASPTIDLYGWVPVWVPGQAYGMNSAVVVEGIAYVAVATLETSTYTPKLAAGEWVQVWDKARSYAAGAVVSYNNYTYDASVAMDPGVEPRLRKLISDGWVPRWQFGMAYTSGQYVTWNGTMYRSITASVDSVAALAITTPSSPNTSGSGWVPVWRQGVAYAAGVYAWYVDRLYLAASDCVGELPVPNITQSGQWVEEWVPARQWASRTYIHHVGTVYRAFGDISASMEAPVSRNSVGAGWVPVHSKSATPLVISRGCYVCSVQGALYRAGKTDQTLAATAPATTTASADGWVPLYAPIAYPRGSYVIDSGGQLFKSLVGQTVATVVAPSDALPQQQTAWQPVRLAAGSSSGSFLGYTFGSHIGSVYGDSILRTYAGAPRTPTAPAYAAAGWVPVWSHDQRYPIGAVTVKPEDNVCYKAVVSPVQGAAPAPQTAAKDGWVRVWAYGCPTLLNEYVYHCGMYYRACLDVTGLSSTAPAPGNLTGQGWIMVFEQGYVFPVGCIAVNPVDGLRVGWVPLWTAGGAYGLGQHVYDPDTLLFYRAVSVDGVDLGGLRPVPVNKPGTGWVALWDPAVAYAPDSLVIDVRNDAWYVAATAVAIGTTVTANLLGRDGWVQVHRAADQFVPGTYVCCLPLGVYYFAASEVGGALPGPNRVGQFGWVPLWVPGLPYAAGEYVIFDARLYYAVADLAPAVDGTGTFLEPDTDARWARDIIPTNMYMKDDTVVYSGVAYRALLDQGANNLPAESNLDPDKWLTVFSSSATYPAKKMVLTPSNHVFVSYEPPLVTDVPGLPRAQQPPPRSSWAPLWSSAPQAASAVGDMVFYGGAFFTAVTAWELDAAPPSVQKQDARGWVALFDPVNPAGYAQGSMVQYGGDLYQAMSAVGVGAAPGRTFDASVGWAPLWSSTSSYSKGEYVVFNGGVYYALAQQPASSLPPNATGNVDSWARPWNPSITYAPGAVVVKDGAAYSCVAQQVAGIAPVPQQLGVGALSLPVADDSQRWLPVYSNAVRYYANALVMHERCVYLACDADPTLLPLPGTAPVQGGRVLSGWVSVWTPASGVLYAPESYVYYDGAYYKAASTGVLGVPLPSYAGITPQPLTNNVAGWVPVWLSDAAYMPGNVVCGPQDGHSYTAVSVPQMGKPPAPSLLSPDGWMRVWSASLSFAPREYCLYCNVAQGLDAATGSMFRALSGLAPSQAAPTSTTRAAQGWVPLWKPTAMYPQGLLAVGPSDGLFYIAATSVLAGVLPGVHAGRVSGWVPLWQEGVPFAVGDNVYVSPSAAGSPSDAGYYVCATKTTAGPAVNSSGAAGWVPVWTPVLSLPKGSYFMQDGTLMFTDAALSPSVTIPLQVARPWLASIAYNAGSIVVYDGLAYTCIVGQAANNYPDPSSADASSWIRVFSAQHQYSAGQMVMLDGDAYIARDASDLAAAPRQAVTALSGWIPLWKKFTAYYEGQYVHSNGVFYYAYTVPSSNVSTGTQEPPVPARTSASRWLPVWDPKTLYPANAVLCVADGTAYMASTVPAVGVAPRPNTVGVIGWVAVWKAARPVPYLPGEFVSYVLVGVITSTIAYFKAIGGAALDSAPLPSTMSTAGWVPFWSSTVAYSSGQVVVSPGGMVYIAASAVPPATEPAPNTVGASGWVMVWAPPAAASDALAPQITPAAYPASTMCYYGGYYWRALTEVASSAEPTACLTGSGWGRVLSSGTSYQAEEYLWDATLQRLLYTPQPAPGSFGDWVQPWSGQYSYNAGSYVVYNGAVYSCQVAQPAGSVPISNSTDTSAWMAKFNTTLVYGAGSVVELLSVAYVAVGPRATASPPARPEFLVSDRSSWVPKWAASDAAAGRYAAGQVVYWDGQCYKAGTSGAELALAPFPINRSGRGWVPYWDPALRYTQGELVYTAAGVLAFAASDPQVGLEPSCATSPAGWVPVWSPAFTQALRPAHGDVTVFSASGSYADASFASAAARFYRAFVPAALPQTAQAEVLAQAPPARQSVAAAVGWVPFWQRGVAYSASETVAGVNDDQVYTAVSTPPPGRTPAPTTRFVSGWLQVWSHTAAHQAGVYVTHGAAVYVATTTPSVASAPSRNSAGVVGWLPVWRKTDAYAAGEYVVFNNKAFYAIATSRSVTPDLSPRTWAGRFMTNMPYVKDSVVIIDGVAHTNPKFQEPRTAPAAPGGDDISGWVRLYNPGMAYAPGDLVSFNLQPYAAVTSVPAGAAPPVAISASAPATPAAGWVRVWTRGDGSPRQVLYALGEYVYHCGSLYRAVVSVRRAAVEAPSPASNAPVGWLRTWSPTTLYDGGSLAVGPDGYVYSTVTAPPAGQAPRPNLANSRGWLAAWSCARPFSAGEYVSHPDGVFYAAATVRPSTILPLVSASWSKGWVHTVGYAAGTCVIHQGVAYGCTHQQDANREPYFNTRNARSWAPMYSAESEYPPNQLVAHRGTVYIAAAAIRSGGEQPAWLATGLGGWVPMWRPLPADSYSPGQCVYHINLPPGQDVWSVRFGSFYRLYGRSSNAEPLPSIESDLGALEWGWLRVYQQTMVYAAGDVVTDSQQDVYIAATNPEVGAGTGPNTHMLNSMPSAVGWVPLYVRGRAYDQGQAVYHRGGYFFTATSVPQGAAQPTPPARNTTAKSWVPLWDASAPYAAGAVVVGSGNQLYIAASAPGAGTAPSINISGLSGWVHAWSAPAGLGLGGDKYSVGTFVWHMNRFYRSACAVAVEVVPCPNRVNGLQGWVQVWDNRSGYGAGEYVQHAGAVYFSLTSISASVQSPDNSASGWARQYSDAAQYPAGSVVVWDGVAYSCVKPVAAGVAPAPGPAAAGAWVPVYSSAGDYAAASLVAHLGVVYLSVEARPPADPLADSSRADLGGWVPVWGASLVTAPVSSYRRGQFVALLPSQHGAGDQTYFYKSFDAAGLDTQPSALLVGAPAGGWVPLWQSALVYGANSVVVNAQGGFFVAAAQVGAGVSPTPADSLGGWVPFWRGPSGGSVRAFAVGDVVCHSPTGRYDTASLRFFKAYSIVPDLASVAPTTSNLSGGGWIPFWSLGSTYVAGAAVYGADGRIYIGATAPVPGVAPVKPVLDTAQGWVALWRSQDAYAVREVVATPLLPDRVADFYIAATAPDAGAAPTRNYVGERGWLPMWAAAKLYTAAEYVSSAGAVYFSKGVVRPGLDAPSTNAVSWARAWLSQYNYSAGDTVVYEGIAYSCTSRPAYGVAPVAAPTTSGGWIPAYSATTSYPAGRLVVHQRRAYIAATLCSPGVLPATNTSGPLLWVPIWQAGDAAVKAGCFVAYTSSGNYVKPQFYFAQAETSLTTVAPVLQATVATALTCGFVPLWDRLVAYDVDSLAFNAADKGVYVAASKPTLGQQPAENTTGLRSWVGTWSAGRGFSAGSYCYSAGSYYLALVAAGTGATKPSSPVSSLRVWVPAWKKELDYAQNTFVASELGALVYIAATGVPKGIQPAQNVVGPSLWVPVWSPTVAYGAGEHAYCYDERLGAVGVYFKAATAVGPGVRPVRNFDGALGWLPLWTPQLAYRAAELVLSDGTLYAAVLDAPSGPSAPASSAAWVGPWQASSAYPAGSSVTYNGQLFTCVLNLPRFQNPPAAQTQTVSGWIPAFSPARASTYGKGQLVSYRARVFCAVGTELQELPSQSVRTLRSWVPVWQAGDVYGTGVFVAYASDGLYGSTPLYIASTDNGLLASAAPQSSGGSTGEGWVQVYSAASPYAPGAVVADASGSIFYAITAPSAQAAPVGASSASGWLQVWRPAVPYPPGRYVAHKNYKGVLAYAAARVVVPSYASPADSASWSRQWSASLRYTEGAAVWYNGQQFIKSRASVSTLPPSVGDWTPVWSASVSYPAVSLVYHDGAVYVALHPSQQGAAAPDQSVAARSPAGLLWAQRYTESTQYDAGVLVTVDGLMVFQARKRQVRHALPPPASPMSLNADGWLPAWQDLTMYNRGALVVHWLPGMDWPTVFQAANDVFGVEPALHNPVASDWLPVWDPRSSYEPGAHVMCDGAVYSSTVAKAPGSFRPGDARDQGLRQVGDWLPAWLPGAPYAIGDTVIHMGDVFIAFVPTPTALPFMNSPEWVPFWRGGVQYAAGSVVMYDPVQVSLASTMFVANVGDASLGQAPPERVNKTGRGWVPVWRPPSVPFQPGEYVFDDGQFFGTMQMQAVGSRPPRYSSTNDTTGWIRAWVPRASSFARSDVLVGEGINALLSSKALDAAFSASAQFAVQQARAFDPASGAPGLAAYVDPYLDAPTIIPVPSWSPTVAVGSVYTQGTLVFHQGVTYIAYSDVPASMEPPPPLQSGVTGWIPVWTDTLAYNVGMTVYHAAAPQGSRLFIARTYDRLDTAPLNVNLTGLGWVPLYSTSRATLTVGEYLYVYPRRAYYGVYPGIDMRPLLQPAINDTGGVPGAWTPPLQGDAARLYTQGSVVFFQGDMYIAANDTSASPQGLSNTTGVDWVPVWRAGLQYQPLDHVYYAPNATITIYTARLHTQFVARGVTDTSTPPTADNKSGFGWVDRWTSARAQAPLSFTYNKGVFYILMTRSGSVSDAVSKTQPSGTTTLQGWVPVWAPGLSSLTQGSIVYDTETSDPYILVTGNTAAPLSSSLDWQNAWNLSRTYLQGSGVTHRGERFLAFSDLTGVEPAMSAITTTGWVPVFRQSAFYAPMTLVVRNGLIYGTSTAQVPLSDLGNFSKLWAVVWQAGATYAPMSEAYFEGVRYATVQGQLLASGSFPYSLWYRVWFPSLAFKLGAIVFFGGALYAYVNTDDVPDPYPGRTPLAWVPVFTSGRSYERGTIVYYQRYVYMLTATIAPGDALKSSNSTVIWSQSSGSSLAQAVKRMVDVNLIPTYNKMHSIMTIAKGVLGVRAQSLPVSELFLCISFVKEMTELKTVMWDDCRNLGIDEYVLERLSRLTISEHPTALFLQEFRDQTAQMITTTAERLRTYNEETARLMQTIAAKFLYYAEAAAQARGMAL